jgi:hypothetical protein
MALELVLGRSSAVVIGAGRFAAYKSGFELQLLVVTFDDHLDVGFAIDDGWSSGHPGSRPRETPEPDEQLRVGIEYADRSRTGEFTRPFAARAQKPKGPSMMLRSGSSGTDEWRHTLWITPLPPSGRLTFAVQWPVAGVPLTLTEIEAELILDAAARSLELRRRRGRTR